MKFEFFFFPVHSFKETSLFYSNSLVLASEEVWYCTNRTLESSVRERASERRSREGQSSVKAHFFSRLYSSFLFLNIHFLQCVSVYSPTHLLLLRFENLFTLGRRVAMRYVTIHDQHRRGAGLAPLQKSRRNPRLMCEQKPFPVCISCQLKSYPVLYSVNID